MDLVLYVYFPAMLGFAFFAGLTVGLRETNRRLKRQREVMERLEGKTSPDFIPQLHDDILNASNFSKLILQNAMGSMGASSGSPLQAQLGNAKTPLLGGASMRNVVNYSASSSQFQIGARTAAGAQAMDSQAQSMIVKKMNEAINAMRRPGE